MADNTVNPDNADAHTGGSNDDTILSALKGAGEVSLAAFSRLGDLAGEFGKNFRADRDAAADTPSGAHASPDDKIVDDHAGLADQLKAAVANARQAYQGAENDRDFGAATSSFAGDVESIFRDFAGSVTRAADSARESDEAEKAKAAFGDAVTEVRETFNAAVSQVRNRADNSDVDVEGTVNDMRARLDEVVNRVAATFGNGNGKDAGVSESAKAESDNADAADIIDGDVVDDGTDGTHAAGSADSDLK